MQCPDWSLPIEIRMTRTRKIVMWSAVTASLLAGSAVILPALISEGHADYARNATVPRDLDLAGFREKKYGPWLVKPERLYEAMNTVDTTAQKKRGLLLIE